MVLLVPVAEAKKGPVLGVREGSSSFYLCLLLMNPGGHPDGKQLDRKAFESRSVLLKDCPGSGLFKKQNKTKKNS